MSNTNLNYLTTESQQEAYFTYEQYCSILKYLTDFQDKNYYCFKIDTIENKQLDSVDILDLKTLNTVTMPFSEYLNIRDQLYLIPIKYYKDEIAYVDFKFLAELKQLCKNRISNLELDRKSRAFKIQQYSSLIFTIILFICGILNIVLELNIEPYALLFAWVIIGVPLVGVDILFINEKVSSTLDINFNLFKEEELFKNSIKTLKAKYKV